MRIAVLEDSPNTNGSTICHSPAFQQTENCQAEREKQQDKNIGIKEHA